MGIDVGKAYTNAAELKSYASKLRMAEKTMERFSAELSNNWEGREVQYYLNAILRVEKEISQECSELEAVGNAIINTANQIRQEEEAAARARLEAEACAAQANSGSRTTTSKSTSRVGSRTSRIGSTFKLGR